MDGMDGDGWRWIAMDGDGWLASKQGWTEDGDGDRRINGIYGMDY